MHIKVNAGEPVIPDNKSRDFLLLTKTGCRYDHRYCDHAYPEKLPKYVGADQKRDPSYDADEKGLLGVERLNEILQKYLNPEEPKNGAA